MLSYKHCWNLYDNYEFNRSEDKNFDEKFKQETRNIQDFRNPNLKLPRYNYLTMQAFKMQKVQKLQGPYL